MQPDALNLRHLASLAATARLGSLSAAAQAIRLTQPALTQGLAKLERQFGEPLFERRPGRMVATPPTLVLAPRIEAALAYIASPRVTLAQMRALIALADAGSYPVASAATGLSQPTLHRAVGDLSIGLRRVLVERRGKGIAFTDAGRSTVRAFRLARAELVAGLSEVAALRGRETGRITVGAMPLSRARLLPAAVTAFHRVHPQVEIRIVEGSHAELIEPLRDGEIDLLIGALRDPAPGGCCRKAYSERSSVRCQARTNGKQLLRGLQSGQCPTRRYSRVPDRAHLSQRDHHARCELRSRRDRLCDRVRRRDRRV